MKKFSFLTILVFSFLFSTSQSIIGDWEGALSVNGGELKAIFHIKKDSTGNMTGLFDSPQQMAYGLKCTSVLLHSDSVLIEMKSFGGKYAGKLGADRKSMTGNWFQGGASLPLNMIKTSEEATVNGLKRPQTPKPPFNYFSDEVTYTNANNSITFGATITRPMDKVLKKHPAVILITGSGQQDRDETIFEHKPFAVIADHLTRQGIIVLRVDDRGIGKTTGSFKNSTSADFSKDVEPGIEYLKTRKDVDINNIGLLGHSEGGLIAPMLAAKRKDIKFIVLLAGPGVPIDELMMQQVTDNLLAIGVDKKDAELYIPFYRNAVSLAIKEKDSASAAIKISKAFDEWQAHTPAISVKNTTGVTDEKSKKYFLNEFTGELNDTWFNYFIKAKPADYLNKVKCAVLALNGEKDIQVAAAPNTEAIRKIMVEKMVKTFKVQVLPGLNHMFQHYKKCTLPEYGEIEETFAPEALQIISDWIKEVTAK